MKVCCDWGHRISLPTVIQISTTSTPVLSGCFSENTGDVPWVISGNGLPVPDLKYLSTAEEAEMRIWRHATQTSAQHILLTEMYNIGLPIVQEQYSSIQCILQLNVPHSPVLKYLHINNLIQALEDDPDLVTQRQTPNHYSDALYFMFPISVA